MLKFNLIKLETRFIYVIKDRSAYARLLIDVSE